MCYDQNFLHIFVDYENLFGAVLMEADFNKTYFLYAIQLKYDGEIFDVLVKLWSYQNNIMLPWDYGST